MIYLTLELSGITLDLEKSKVRHHHSLYVIVNSYSLDEALLGAVPKCLSVESIVLYSNRIDGCIYLKRTLLEHHNARVVDTGTLREYQYGQILT